MWLSSGPKPITSHTLEYEFPSHELKGKILVSELQEFKVEVREDKMFKVLFRHVIVLDHQH